MYWKECENSNRERISLRRHKKSAAWCDGEDLAQRTRLIHCLHWIYDDKNVNGKISGSSWMGGYANKSEMSFSLARLVLCQLLSQSGWSEQSIKNKKGHKEKRNNGWKEGNFHHRACVKNNSINGPAAGLIARAAKHALIRSTSGSQHACSCSISYAYADED